ncbi:hypothetical protein T439DRAFT_320450 [Meredithblackwellia eburnea MCA 4105]
MGLFDFVKSIFFTSLPVSPEQTKAATTLVEEMISSNQVAVFSKSYCPYCSQAKAILNKVGQDSKTKVIELDHDSNGAAIQQFLATRIGQQKVTVPQIYINQKLIGGCSDLQALHSAGKLQSLLQ